MWGSRIKKKGLITLYPHVIRSVLIMSTHGSNFITLPTGGGLRWQLLPISVENKTGAGIEVTKAI